MVVSKWPGKIYAPRSTVTHTIEKCQKATKNDEKWKFLFSFSMKSERFSNRFGCRKPSYKIYGCFR